MQIKQIKNLSTQLNNKLSIFDNRVKYLSPLINNTIVWTDENDTMHNIDLSSLAGSGGSSAYFEDTFVCGENITAGQICYFNTSTGKLNLAIDNGTAKDNLLYVAKESGALNDSIKVASTGNIDFLSGLTAGQSYALSKTTAGAFAPFSSFTAGDYVVRIFTALTDTKVKFYDEPVIMQV
ncbi:hypothetical protein [Francisella philomiragia]|uniref:Uncharacterized protein n=1 Tax=Francisella philomiragia TaxID=28110 RepID=A0ABS1GDU4_9GAMM|nr:hypothetical protein [Francisella philomiragia]MBK2259003.1 hypothetical protein [Francisella philomiragia]MBK2302694.1 hypothetical protein [Francisella philomiragia]